MTHYQESHAGASIEAYYFFKAAALAGIGFKAAQNHYNRGLPLADAAFQGAVCARRWQTWWFFFATAWVGAGVNAWSIYVQTRPGFVDYSGNQGVAQSSTTLIIFGSVILAIFGITYCRHIDFGLFQRRLLYWLFSPLYRLMQWCPSWVLYCVVVAALIVPSWVV